MRRERAEKEAVQLHEFALRKGNEKTGVWGKPGRK